MLTEESKSVWEGEIQGRQLQKHRRERRRQVSGGSKCVSVIGKIEATLVDTFKQL